MDLFVTFLGTAASVPTSARGVAATLVARGGDRWLVDCGEGTQRQLLRSGQGLVDVDRILLTHLHGDHYLGLPGLFKTYGLRGRERPLEVVGPRGLFRMMDLLAPLIGRLPFPVELDEIDHAPDDALRGEGFRIEAFPTRHSVASLGYALVEDPRPGAFDVAAARALGVPEGPDFGVLQRGGEVTGRDGRTVRPQEVLGEPRPGRRVVLTGDTEPWPGTGEAARGADLLVHEATFLHEDMLRARETRHSTAREAGEVARDAGVGLLALTHLSSRVMPADARAEAATVFGGEILVPRDFDQIEIPFAERGAPIVHPARRGGRREGADVASDPPATLPVE